MTTPTRTTDRTVAERLRWTNIEPFIYWEETYYDAYEVEALRGTSPEGWTDRILPRYKTDLNAAWRLQQEHPIPGTICLNLEWLQLPPQLAAREMTNAWLRWAIAENYTAAAGEEGA